MKIIVLIAIAAPLMAGCHRRGTDDHRRTVESGRKTIPWVSKIEKHAGADNVESLIIHYGGDEELKEWKTKVFFYDRYEMAICQDVIVDFRSNRIKRTVGDMRITINEVVRFDPEKLHAKYGDQIVCGEQEWNRFLRSEGDFSEFSAKIKKREPIKDFDRYKEGRRVKYIE